MAESSFDISSKVDQQEVSNAIDMVHKEIDNRFDFKGANVGIKLEKEAIQLSTSDEMRMKQLIDVIQSKLVKRGLNLKAFKFGEFESNVSGTVKCTCSIQNTLTQEQIKTITKMIKDSKLKVQPRIQGDAVRVTGKSRDDLQEVIQMIKNADLDFHTTFDNYR